MGVALAAIPDDDDFFALDQVQVGVAIVINTHGRSSWLGGRTARIVMSVKYRRVVGTPWQAISRRWSSPFSRQGETGFCMAEGGIMRRPRRDEGRSAARGPPRW